MTSGQAAERVKRLFNTPSVDTTRLQYTLRALIPYSYVVTVYKRFVDYYFYSEAPSLVLYYLPIEK